MDVRGRGEAALMGPSIARRSMKGKEFAKKHDGCGHVGGSDADDLQLCIGLLVNLASAGTHFTQILVVWSIKIAGFGLRGCPVLKETGVILRKSVAWRHEVA